MRTPVRLLMFAATVSMAAPAARAEDPPLLCNGLTPTITADAPGVVQGTAGADVILVRGTPIGTVAATTGPTIVHAMAGDDVICLPGNAANVVLSGDGVDTVSYEHAPQLVVATMNAAAVRFKMDLDNLNLVSTLTGFAPGIDLLPQTERLIGSPQDDVLIGHLLDADMIKGGAGDDVIVGLYGNDQLFGEAGNDAIIGDGYDETVYGPFDGITVGTTTTPVLATDNDLLDGGSGNDSLSDDTEDNTFRGGTGNDGIAQGFGNDTIDGGTGSDHVSYAQRQAFVDLNVTVAQDTNHGLDKLTSIENLTGSDFNDTLIGNNSVNILIGGPGDDRIAGGLVFSAAIDQLEGGEGMDVCHRAPGNFSSFVANCECPNVLLPACSVDPYKWVPSDGIER